MNKLFFVVFLMFDFIELPLNAQELKSTKEKLLTCNLIYSDTDECEKDKTTQTWVCNKKLKQFKIINGEAMETAMPDRKINISPEQKEACSKEETYCYQSASGKVFVKSAPAKISTQADAEINEKAFGCFIDKQSFDRGQNNDF